MKKHLVTEKVYLSSCEEDIAERLYVDPKIFDREQEVYQDNLLQILMDIIGKELWRLTKLQREIILRFYYKQQTFHLIAKDLAVSPQAVHQAYTRALSTLKRRLGDNPYFIKVHDEYVVNDPTVDILVKISAFFDK